MNKSYEKKLIAALIKAGKDEKVLKAFLTEVLTEKEYVELVRRFEILTRLIAGEAQRAIATDLGLGIATVTRGSHVVSRGAKAFKKVTGVKQ